MKDRKIDLVYLWCDGNDPSFIERRTKALKKLNKDYNIDATDNSRVFQVDELKFSLRSVDKYMPWINHIYIVTDHQTPKWLDLNNPKVSVIEQSSLLPDDVKFCFNSNAVESVLYKIPNLSEYFIYANDDMFVNKPVSPDFFFDKKGRCIVWGDLQKLNPEKDLYSQQLLYVHDKIKKKFGLDLPINPHHNFDPYLKSDCKACAKCFSKEFDDTVHHAFRQFDSVQRLIFHLYSIAKGRGVFKNLEDTKWYQKRVSMYIANHTTQRFNLVKKQQPILFCLNDTAKSQQKHRMNALNFLNAMYPYPSSFESNGEYRVAKEFSVSVWKFRDVKSISDDWFVRTVQFSILEMTLYRIRQEPKSGRFYLFGFLPLLKIAYSKDKRVFKLFNFIPIVRLKRKL